jgi:hypothetical protein
MSTGSTRSPRETRIGFLRMTSDRTRQCLVLFTWRSFGFIADVAHRVGARLGIPATGYQSNSMTDSKQEELIEEESRWVESKILARTIAFLIYQ